MQKRFSNRIDAGKQLAVGLKQYADRDDVLVLALPRGGVPVAYEVARALNAPLDLLLVRKLGVPGHEEFAMGAIASEDTVFINESTVKSLHIDKQTVDNVIQKEQRELQKREALFRDARPKVEVKGRTVIIVDDGLATGATMKAAIQALRQRQPAAIVLAVPTAPRDVIHDFEDEVEDVICLMTPEPFGGVGRWYMDFPQTSNETVLEYLHSQLKFAP